MQSNTNDALAFVLGFEQGRLTRADLPSPRIARWYASQKVILLAALQSGLISFEEASRRYALSLEELAQWSQAFDRHGMAGLRATKGNRWPRKPVTQPAAIGRDLAHSAVM